MVKQGDIIKICFDPQMGHEQSGYRPALVVSNDTFNAHCSMTLVCPITNTKKDFPLHIALDDRTSTTGVVLCEQIRSLDLTARSFHFVERIPDDLLDEILETVACEIAKE